MKRLANGYLLELELKEWVVQRRKAFLIKGTSSKNVQRQQYVGGLWGEANHQL